MKRVSSIIVAAGEGRRFGSTKQFASLRGKSVLDWCLEKFEAHPKVDEIILVLAELEEKERFLGLYRKIVAVVKGGETRQDSVFRGFAKIDSEKTKIVLVHDGVRPLVREDLISRVIQETQNWGAAIPALPLEETIKEVAGGEVIRTLDRARLYRVQTPQGFLYPVLKTALEWAAKEEYYGTDEAMLVEKVGKKVFIVEGDPRNIKITTPRDIAIAEVLFEA